jgi:phage-related protein
MLFAPPFTLLGLTWHCVYGWADERRGHRIVLVLSPDFWLDTINGFVNVNRMEWEIVYYGEDVQGVLLDFPAGIQARYIHLTQRMLAFGPDLGMPHTRALGKGLFELRMKSKEGIGRVFFCTLASQRIMMLHAFMKKSAKTPAKELKIARARLKEVKTDADT